MDAHAVYVSGLDGRVSREQLTEHFSLTGIYAGFQEPDVTVAENLYVNAAVLSHMVGTEVSSTDTWEDMQKADPDIQQVIRYLLSKPGEKPSKESMSRENRHLLQESKRLRVENGTLYRV